MVHVGKLIKSFKHALSGLKHTLIFHQNLRVHVIVGFLTVLVGLILKISKIEWVVIVAAIFFVLIAEMINTALEEITNLVKEDHSERARIAKDVSAGMVLLAVIFAVVIGVVIFIPYLF
jgi:diacylglycerol kinase